MKRLIITSSILILIVCLGICSLLYLYHTNEQITQITMTAQEAVNQGDIKRAQEQIDALSNLWTKAEPCMSSLVRHNDVDEISKYMSELYPLLEHNEMGLLSCELNKIQLISEHITESETPTFFHIF